MIDQTNIKIIETFLLTPLAIVVGIKALFHHMKMFQQSSYRPERFYSWLKNNVTTYKFHIVLLVVVLIFTLFDIIQLMLFDVNNISTIKNQQVNSFVKMMFQLIKSITYFLFICYTINFYYFKKNTNIKPLVVTPRVKRMFVTIFILFTIVILSNLFLKDTLAMALNYTMFFIATLPVIIMLSNFINSPIEKSINNKFINEAKSLLNAHKDLITIGITGSYGKTSMKNYLTELLKVKYNVLMTPESYNTPMGVVKTVRSSLTGVTEIFVCEMGAKNEFDIEELCNIAKPDHAIITAIGPQHLETFKSIDTIIKTKYELVDSIKNDGIILLNGDSEHITNNLPNKAHFTYSCTHSSNYQPYDITLTPEGTTFTLKTENECCTFTTKLIGEHNVLNLVGAIMMCNKLGITLEQLKPQVAKINSVSHRLEVKKGSDMTIIDDAFNSNPDGAKVALNTLSLFDGFKVLITPGMVELGEIQYKENYNFAVNATKVCDYIILVGPKQTEPMQEALKAKDFDENKYFVAQNFHEAFALAKSLESNKHKYVLIENDLPDNYQK